MSAAQDREDTLSVWDAPVRVFHWLLVLALIGSYLTQELEGNYFRYHVWFGYTVIVLVTSRIIWGLVGPRHARFSSFLRGPRATGRYLMSLFRPPYEAYTGHNPLGGLMVIAMLVLLLAQGVTGLFANDQIFDTGPLFGYVSAATSDDLTAWHHRIFNALLVLTALHVAAVFGYLFLRRENLITPMFTGRKLRQHVRAGEEITGSQVWLALLIAGAVAGALTWVVRTAPPATLSLF
jgi:cytochrome b